MILRVTVTGEVECHETRSGSESEPEHPERVIEYAVKGMLPKGPLGRQMYTKLFVYAGPDHKHAAQKPEVLTF